MYFNEHKLNEFDKEVSKYLDGIMKDTNENLIADAEPELENINEILVEENKKLNIKLDEYMELNKNWETKIINIKKILNELEERNTTYKNENETLKDEVENLNFKIKLMLEKEKNHETSVKNFKELQNEYENRNNEIKQDFKNKEENLKRKFENLEENQNLKLKEQEEEFNEKMKKLTNQLKDCQNLNSKITLQCNEYRDKFIESEKFFQSKEAEFEEAINSKDKKLKELELCIKSISDEANTQITKLSQSVNDFNEKINSYKQREIELVNNYNELKNQIKYNNFKEEMFNTFQLESERLRQQAQDPQNDTKARTIETLRGRVKELEEENIYLSRDLNLKLEESQTISEELRLAYDTIRVNEIEAETVIRAKDEELYSLTNKLNEFEIIIQKYGQNLGNIHKHFDKTNLDNKSEIQAKDIVIKQLQEKVGDLQEKLQEVLLRENIFIQKLNSNPSVNDNCSLYSSRRDEYSNTNRPQNYYSYVPKNLPDDEEIRNSITEKIDNIKQKLNRAYFQR